MAKGHNGSKFVAGKEPPKDPGQLAVEAAKQRTKKQDIADDPTAGAHQKPGQLEF